MKSLNVDQALISKTSCQDGIGVHQSAIVMQKAYLKKGIPRGERNVIQISCYLRGHNYIAVVVFLKWLGLVGLVS